MKDLNWNEFKSSKIKSYQLGNEPEVVYVIKIRHNEYLVVHEDGYDLNTGKTEFLSAVELKLKYSIIFK